MKIPMSAEQLSALKSFLNRFEDCEQLSESEYVLDLYDLEPPLSLDLSIGKNCLFVDGAATLLFDEEMDGWYIGERIEEPEPILRALEEAGALGA
ncbi:MAG: hypothetical protein ACI4MF_02220 [Candidatus Faecivicinus sp.]